MAQVQIEGIVDHLSSEMRRALDAAVSETLPGAHFDAHALFRAFRRVAQAAQAAKKKYEPFTEANSAPAWTRTAKPGTSLSPT